jgi:hypothetical protein
MFLIAVFCSLQAVTITLPDYADDMPVYLNMPFSYTINNAEEKSAVIRTSGNENLGATAILTELAGSMKPLPYMIPN